jgi:hypothetical protein
MSSMKKIAYFNKFPYCPHDSNMISINSGGICGGQIVNNYAENMKKNFYRGENMFVNNASKKKNNRRKNNKVSSQRGNLVSSQGHNVLGLVK